TDSLYGSSRTVTKSYNNEGTKTARVTVRSGTQTSYADCSAVVNHSTPKLSVSCTVSPDPVQAGTFTSVFTAHPTGGNGTYHYLWTGDCNGTWSSCSEKFTTAGIKTVLLTVTVMGETATAKCSTTVTQPPPPTLDVSCSANPNSIDVGQSTTWSANASGGTGSYTYSWTGTDSLYGSSRTVTKSYNNEGTKTARVTVRSGTQTSYADCSAVVSEIPLPNLTASCSANPNSIDVGQSTTWSANASGGTGSYTYSWTGTDSLYGSSRTVTKSYNNEGTKTARVTVTSGGITASATCYTTVEQQVTDLEVSCSADEDNIEIDDSVRFTADVSGGTGSYTYSWSGTNNLYGSSRTVTKSYSTEGTKTARVTVTSGGITSSATCYTTVEEQTSDLEVSCSADDDNIESGESIRWVAEADGGTGSYRYSWSGTDDLDGSSRTVKQKYYDEGEKKARVKVTSGDDVEYATCYADVEADNQVLSYVQTTNPIMPLAASVYLSDVPYTGAGDSIKIILFVTTLGLWSIFLAYYLLRRRMNNKQELAIVESTTTNSNDTFKVQTDFVQNVELDNKALKDIEDYARMNKVSLSSSATEKILKLGRLGKVNASSLIKGLSTGEWIAVSDEDIKE
ncbi:MAG: hypothetical protein WC827_04855, partial [Candidatus Paceibacterota bacterium]